MTSSIHCSKVGTYHPAPKKVVCATCGETAPDRSSLAGLVHKWGPTTHPFKAKTINDVAWTVHDSRGYLDGGSPCSECGTCDCTRTDTDLPLCEVERSNDDSECIGLSFAYVCLDGGGTLCEECFEKDGSVKVIDCDCP